MILKFCFHQEIHRCSEPPEKFESLEPLLKKMFLNSLPDKFLLFSVNQSGDYVPISDGEDYEKLKSLDPSKPIKVIIVEQEENEKSLSQNSIEEDYQKLEVSDCEIIQHQSAELQENVGIFPEESIIEKEEDNQEDEEEKVEDTYIESEKQNEQQDEEIIPHQDPEQEDVLQRNEEVKAIELKDEEIAAQAHNIEQLKEAYEPLIEQISQDLTSRHVVTQLQSHMVDSATRENIRKVVKECLQQQIPSIISEIRRSFLDQGLITLSQYNSQPQAPIGQLDPKPQPLPEPQLQPQLLPEPQQVIIARPSQERRPSNDKADNSKNSKQNIFVKAVQAIGGLSETIAYKIEGNVQSYSVKEKYTQATIDKADQLKCIFADEDKRYLLDFVAGLPEAMPLEQIVDIYLSRKNV